MKLSKQNSIIENDNIKKVAQPLNKVLHGKSVNVFDKYQAEQNQSPDDMMASFKAKIGENRKVIVGEESDNEDDDESDDDW